MNHDRPRGAPKVFLLLLALVSLAVLGLFAFRAGPPPSVTLTSSLPAIGKRTAIRVVAEEPVRGLSRVKVEFAQGDRVEVLAEKTYTYRGALSFWGERDPRDEFSAEVGRDTISGLKAGEAVVRVTAARVPGWLRRPDPVVKELIMPVRLLPPPLQVNSTQVYVAQGGCEVVVYRIGESSVRDGVRVGEWWFPGYQLPGGGKQDRFALFAIPYDVGAPEARLVTADDAGNEAQASFIEKFFPKPFKADTIEVNDGFLNKVVPEIMSQTPDFRDRGNPLDNYVAINNELRRQNAATLRELSKHSRPEFLWRKAFQPLINAKVMSAFADRRTYMYKGRKIDHQDHLGFDLAATRRTPVPAENDGIVALAKYFGIYGNAVVLDHGFGLMTLYGHLASVSVSQGQSVRTGDTLGLSGETGLAGGDHLHFTILLHGLPVNPVEWWDSHWIRDRISKKLGPAFPFEE